MRSGFRNSRVNGRLSTSHGGGNTAEDVEVELFHQKRFQRTPQIPWAKERLIIRDQHHLAGIARCLDVVRTAKREDATLDAQALFDDFESQQVRGFTRGDALCQVAPAVCAPDW